MRRSHPRAPLELQVQLRVVAVAEILDGVDLSRVESGARELEPAQHDERDGEHHAIGENRFDARAARESQLVGSVAKAAQPGERASESDAARRERRGDRFGQRLASARQDVALIGVSEHVHLAILGVIGLGAQLLDQIHRAELVDLAPVLVAVRFFDEAPELRVESARNVTREPIANAHRVELPRHRVCILIRRVRWEPRELRFENWVDLRKIPVGGRHRIVAPVEVAGVARAGRTRRVRIEQR